MRALVVGGGSIGKRHLTNLGLLGVEHRAVVEPNPDILASYSSSDVDRFTSLDEGLCRHPDICIIAAPTSLHVDIALSAAQAGCNLLVEKPLSHSETGIERLIEEVDRRRLTTLVGCNMRFHPGPSRIKRILEEQALGRVFSARIFTGSYLPEWRPSTDYLKTYSASPIEGGAILDCIHEIDLAIWYFGPGRLAASKILAAETIGLSTDGLAELLIEHEAGVLSSVHLNFIQRDYKRGCSILGSEGSAYWDFTQRRVETYFARERNTEVFSEPSGWTVNDMYVEELSYFLKCVEEGKSTMNTLHDAFGTLKLALNARGTRSIEGMERKV